MAFKLQSGNVTSFKKMGSSPAKKAGIFEGEGEDRTRVSKKEAAELEAKGKTITRTAADNPNKKEGTQQTKNLGYLAEVDAELQNNAEMAETFPKDHPSYRKKTDKDVIHRWTNDEVITTKVGEDKIRKHENLKGGDPLRSEGYYMVDGVKMNKSEYDAHRKEKEPKGTKTNNKDGSTSITMTPKQYRAWKKKQNK